MNVELRNGRITTRREEALRRALGDAHRSLAAADPGVDSRLVPKAEAVRRGLPDREQLERRAAAAKALGDPTRLAVALALRAGERACVCDLAWIVGREERLVSHHARHLKTAGLARSEREGKMVMYELTERGLALLATVAQAPRARV